jgi:hypothetical protein
MYSVKLYLLLDRHPANDLDTQLSQRLIFLSNAFESAGKQDDRFFLLCLALKMEISHEGVLRVPTEVDALEFLAAKSDGIFPPASNAPLLSQNTLSICRRMALCLVDCPRMESTQKNLSCICGHSEISIFDYFLRRFRDDNENSIHPISSIELFFLRKWHREEEKMTSSLLVLVELLAQLGHSIHNLHTGVDTNAIQSETAKQTYSLLSDVVRKLAKGAVCPNPLVLRYLIEIVISVSMSPIGKQRWTDSDLLIRKEDPWLTQFHYNELEDLLSAEGNCLLDSLRLVMSSLLLATGVESVDQVLPTIVEGAKSAVVLCQTTDDATFLVAKRWIIWAASNVKSICETAGCKEKATLLSLWLIALTENDYISNTWYTSSLLSATANDIKMLCVAEPNRRLTHDSEIDTYPTETTQWLFETELYLCRLHLEILSTGADCSTSYKQQTQALEAVFQQLNESRVSNKDPLLHLWVMSSLCLVHSDLSASFADFPSALNWTHECLRKCQAIMKVPNVPYQGNSSSIVEAAISSIVVRAAFRYIQVLSKRPRLHYRLGDYRKADAYMKSALDSLQINTDRRKDDEYRPNQLKQLVRSLNVAPEVRLFLEMASWASTPEHAIEHLSTDCASFGPLDRRLSDSDASLVETIQNVVAGKSVGVLFTSPLCSLT